MTSNQDRIADPYDKRAYERLRFAYRIRFLTA